MDQAKSAKKMLRALNEVMQSKCNHPSSNLSSQKKKSSHSLRNLIYGRWTPTTDIEQAAAAATVTCATDEGMQPSCSPRVTKKWLSANGHIKNSQEINKSDSYFRILLESIQNASLSLSHHHRRSKRGHL